MLDYPKALVCVFVLMVLQVSVTPQLYPFGGGPDLIAILVVALALWRGIELAAVAGFVGGLLLDAVLYRHLGMSFGGSHTITNLLAIGVLQAIHVHAQVADEPVYAL